MEDETAKEIFARLAELSKDGCYWGQKEIELMTQAFAFLRKQQGDMRSEWKSDLGAVKQPIETYSGLERENRETLRQLRQDMDNSVGEQGRLNQRFEELKLEYRGSRKEFMEQAEAWKASTCTDLGTTLEKYKLRWYHLVIPGGIVGVIATIMVMVLNSTATNMERRLADTTKSYKEQLDTTSNSLTNQMNRVVKEMDDAEKTREQILQLIRSGKAR